jgi:hypothetical protein
MTHPPTKKYPTEQVDPGSSKSPYKALFQALLLDATSGWSQARKALLSRT